MKRTELNDSYITGAIHVRERLRCERCGNLVLGIWIHKVELPNNIEIASTILRDGATGTRPHIGFIGLNCGCYAKFHRQVAHIQDRINLYKGVRP